MAMLDAKVQEEATGSSMYCETEASHPKCLVTIQKFMEIMEFEHHLQQLLLLLVKARSTDSSIPVKDVKHMWRDSYGNEMQGLLKNCGYLTVESALRNVKGLQVMGEGPDAHVGLAQSTVSILNVTVCLLSGKTLTTCELLKQDRAIKLRSEVDRHLQLCPEWTHKRCTLLFNSTPLSDDSIVGDILADGDVVQAIIDSHKGIAKLVINDSGSYEASFSDVPWNVGD